MPGMEERRESGLEEALRALGAKCRLQPADGPERRRSEFPAAAYPIDGGVVAEFPGGLRMEAGFRILSRAKAREDPKIFVGEPRAGARIWADAREDLLSHDECWYDSDNMLVPCPAGEGFSSVEEFQLLMSALMPSGNPGPA